MGASPIKTIRPSKLKGPRRKWRATPALATAFLQLRRTRDSVKRRQGVPSLREPGTPRGLAVEAGLSTWGCRLPSKRVRVLALILLFSLLLPPYPHLLALLKVLRSLLGTTSRKIWRKEDGAEFCFAVVRKKKDIRNGERERNIPVRDRKSVV